MVYQSRLLAKLHPKLGGLIENILHFQATSAEGASAVESREVAASLDNRSSSFLRFLSTR
jgi:hypothetical protein